MLSIESEVWEHDLHFSPCSSFKTPVYFLIGCSSKTTNSSPSSRYCPSLKQVKDANEEATGLLLRYPLSSKSHMPLRGRKIAKSLLELGNDGLQNLARVFRNLKSD